VSDYGAAEITSIQTLFAARANVALSDVSVSVAAGSVLLTVDIRTADVTAALALETSLGSVTSSSTWLQQAVPSAVVLEVRPTALSQATTSAASGGGCGGGCVGGIIGGCFVSVLMLILWVGGAFTKYGLPSPSPGMAVLAAKQEEQNPQTTTSGDVQEEPNSQSTTSGDVHVEIKSAP
jgi:hypothetical protein